MKKHCFFAVLVMTMGVTQARPVTQAEASQVALQFWTNTLGMKAHLQQHPWEHNQTAYLFLSESRGWVMVAADDVARPILAYSITSQLDPLRLTAATQGFLNIYRQEIAMHSEIYPRHAEWNLLLNKGSIKDSEEESVGPLLTTTWYQMSPYNLLCPSDCMTGCEATAMAQVMKYWNYPAFGEGSHSYNDAGGHGVQSVNFADTRYDWDNMPNRLTSSSSASQKTAVATLIYHCGVAVDMRYSTSQSGAVMTNLTSGLTTYFHYHPRAHLVAKGNMSNGAWTDTLIAELRHHRPIIYGGEGPAGGHVFVCDGFDTRGYLHFNLGEDGSGDGYYQIGAINYGMYSFNSANDCVLGIEPEHGIYFNQHHLDYGRNASQQQVWVMTSDTSQQPWTVTCSDSWITVQSNDFSHLGQITVLVSENNGSSERSGTVVLEQGEYQSTLTVVQAAYDPSTDYCPLTVEMGNSHNEPWAADAHLSFESLSGLVYGTAAHTSNTASSTTQVMVAPSDVMVRWHEGDGRDRYISYRIKNQHGEVLVDVDNAFLDGGDVLLQWPCAHVDIPPTEQRQQVLSRRVYDLSGRLLYQSNGNSPQPGDELPTHLSRGVYIVHIITDNGVTVKKMVKN